MDNDNWIEWNGGECPVDPLALVQTIFRCEDRKSFNPEADEAGKFIWSHDGLDYNIVAYRVVEPSHG